MVIAFFVSWLTACLTPSSGPLATGSPDLVVLADVGVVVADGRIVSVHERVADARALVQPDTVVVPAARVSAGFVDAHIHPVGLGRARLELDLTGTASYADTLNRVEAASGTGWLFGRGWDQNDWSDVPAGGWPTAADLDARTGDRPAMLRRVDGHAAWLNTAALRAAGIDDTTADPPGGRIVRDADGHATGVLIDNALSLVPEGTPTKVEIRRWLVEGLTAMAEVGLTGGHVMGINDATLEVIEYLDRKGTLPLRLWVYVDPDSQAAERLASEGPWSGERVKVVGVKAYADGALGSRGALLSAPYADAPDTSGLAVTSKEDLTQLAVSLTPQGAQLAIHAIGDLGVRHALDAVAVARQQFPEVSVRHRVEHAQVVHPDDRDRFEALSVIASMQPTHATSDMPWAGARLGIERLSWAYTWRSLADAGATLAFGSDAPVEVPDPSAGVWAATRRMTWEGEPAGGWQPGEVVSDTEAWAAYTVGAATAAGDEDQFGTIAAGRVADLSLWAEEDGRMAPVGVVVDGKVVWQRVP